MANGIVFQAFAVTRTTPLTPALCSFWRSPPPEPPLFDQGPPWGRADWSQVYN